LTQEVLQTIIKHINDACLNCFVLQQATVQNTLVCLLLFVVCLSVSVWLLGCFVANNDNYNRNNTQERKIVQYLFLWFCRRTQRETKRIKEPSDMIGRMGSGSSNTTAVAPRAITNNNHGTSTSSAAATQKNIFKVVLTGGPSAGKTKSIDYFRRRAEALGLFLCLVV
jgi:hypothetical protein